VVILESYILVVILESCILVVILERYIALSDGLQPMGFPLPQKLALLRQVKGSETQHLSLWQSIWQKSGILERQPLLFVDCIIK
jgi:hypothetical protein